MWSQFVEFLRDIFETLPGPLPEGITSVVEDGFVFLRLESSKHVHNSQHCRLFTQIDVGTFPSSVTGVLLPRVVLRFPAVLQITRLQDYIIRNILTISFLQK